MDRRKTRDRLVEIAGERFHTKGYAASGVAEILKQAGVGSGSLYHFFESKEDLLGAVLDGYLERLEGDVFAPLFAQVRDPIERIFAILARYRGFLVSNGCQQGCPIANLICELGDTHPGVSRRVSNLFAAWRGGIERCLSEAADRLPSHLDRKAVAALVLSVLEGAVMQCRAARDIGPMDQSIQQLRDYFERLLADGRGSEMNEREK